jgi:MFS family permease
MIYIAMTQDNSESNVNHNESSNRSLSLSQKEGFFSALMTGTFDQYVNAFAVFLGATSVQIGWLTALPQLLGGLFQLITVWFGQWVHRHWLIVVNASLQTLMLGVFALLAMPNMLNVPFHWLIVALSVFIVCSNIIMPHWRAWMGELVPDDIRGQFFGKRNRIAMFTSFISFILGGYLLTFMDEKGLTGYGFVLLFLVAMLGRGVSTWLLAKMHDDHARPTMGERYSLMQSMKHLYSLWDDQDFRRFSFFMAGMSCFVSLSGPFFAVYMLRDLGFSYTEFTLSTASSILAQFLMLPFWGKVCDRKGNRYVMAVGGCVIPFLPAMWLLSDSFTYILILQFIGGIAWSGFTLASANYLYDQKPRNIHFASYSAIHSSLTAMAIFIGAVSGGYIIQWLPESASIAGLHIHIERPVAVIFLLSSVLRLAVMLWYLPKAPELRVSERGRVRDLAYRIVRFTPMSGVVIDVINRRRRKTD